MTAEKLDLILACTLMKLVKACLGVEAFHQVRRLGCYHHETSDEPPQPPGLMEEFFGGTKEYLHKYNLLGVRICLCRM